MEQEIFSVSELNQRIKALLDGEPALQNLYVAGELSNYKTYPSGHHYFTLKDAECALRCVMFKSSAARLVFRPENGMKVVARGRVTVFPRDGAYQLYCTELIPHGAGDLHIAFEQLKQKLHGEGLFDPVHKKPIPRYPAEIALITSGAGAAVRDMIRVLGARWPLAKVVVLPVRVQGAEAPLELVGAIRYANRYQVADLIITGRGGGSIEDLWAFNDERVARAIFDSQIPIISAVGHEPDVTIADYVADLRAATPSNAAELAVPDVRELEESLGTGLARLEQAVKRRLDMERRRLADLASKRVLTSPANYIEDRKIVLDHLQDKLASAYRHLLSVQKERYGRLTAALDALSPLKVLGRGYAIARTEQGILRCAEDAPPGTRLWIRLGTGEVTGVVDEGEGQA